MPVHVAYGDTLKVAAEFRGTDGLHADPGAVTLTVLPPSGSTTTYTYAGATVTKDATGKFSKRLTPTTVGEWHYRFEGTSPAAGVVEDSFIVRSSEFD